ncbi:hypothetical protein SDC9_165757 [bioreactor metagenome]|uniref:Uncharacterized protein n=1 Tax=bioreactor metagenome TaxID=1076179 RepID=A0A645FVD3_9ZZZZ
MLFQLIYCLNQFIELFGIGLPLYTEIIRNLRVSLQCMRMVILREGAHFYRLFGSVEAENLIDHQRVRYTMRQMMKSAELMRHGMAYS